MRILKNFVQYIAAVFYDNFDACPPYIYSEGLLEGKERLDQEGRQVIFVVSTRIEVD